MRGEGVFRCQVDRFVLRNTSLTMMNVEPRPVPLILPLGERGLLVRFAATLSDEANQAAIRFGRRAAGAGLPGVVEVVPHLVSVLLTYDPDRTDFDRLAGEVRLLVSVEADEGSAAAEHEIAVRFDGEDLAEVCGLLRLDVDAFVSAHCERPLRVLAVGFAPGFVYCGFHDKTLTVPRRAEVRRQAPAGTVLFAAGQTAITSTAIPTGWHVIGRTDFRNFDPATDPPAQLAAGDRVLFRASP
jgi:KipI family sensor histidine kinase inhibitor